MKPWADRHDRIHTCASGFLSDIVRVAGGFLAVVLDAEAKYTIATHDLY